MNKGLFSTIDLSLFAPVLVLLVLGLTTLFSINSTYFKTQLFYILFSLPFFLIFANSSLETLKHYAFPIFIVSIISLVVLLIIGAETRGAVRWIDFFGIRIQFSEIIKPFLAVSLACFLGNREKWNASLMIRTLLLSFPIFFLIYVQPDLGNALLYLGVLLFVLIAVGFPLRWFVIGLFLFLAFVPILWGFLHDYQRQRVLAFLNPSSDPLGTSYNAVQSIVAVGSGMFLGKGLGEGTQSGLRFLPERHTDFIFASLGEMFGFVGTIVVVIAFLFLLYRIFLLFQELDNEGDKTFVACIFFLFLIQAFVNIGMNLGILPIVGITLPFVSFGGSSLLSNFIALGMLSSLTRFAKRRDILEIR